MRPMTSSSRKTKQCYGNRNKVAQVTVSMTSDSESLREAVIARPSATDAKTKIKIGFSNVRTGRTAQVNRSRKKCS